MLLAVAERCVAAPFDAPLVIAAFDAEEQGLQGARAFVARAAAAGRPDRPRPQLRHGEPQRQAGDLRRRSRPLAGAAAAAEGAGVAGADHREVRPRHRRRPGRLDAAVGSRPVPQRRHSVRLPRASRITPTTTSPPTPPTRSTHASSAASRRSCLDARSRALDRAAGLQVAWPPRHCWRSSPSSTASTTSSTSPIPRAIRSGPCAASRRRDDQEIVAFLASALAFGRVQSVLQTVDAVLGGDGGGAGGVRPRLHARSGGRGSTALGHRWIRSRDLAALAWLLHQMVRDHGSIEGFFAAGQPPGDRLDRGRARVVLDAGDGARPEGDLRPRRPTPGVGYFFSRPSSGGACKRLNLFLRWVVRHDAVDLGLWEAVRPGAAGRAARHPHHPRRPLPGHDPPRQPGLGMAVDVTRGAAPA